MSKQLFLFNKLYSLVKLTRTQLVVLYLGPLGQQLWWHNQE